MKRFRSHRSHMEFFRTGYFRLFFVLIVVLPFLLYFMDA